MKRSPLRNDPRPAGAHVLRAAAFEWSDAALVEAVRAGDNRAKTALFDRYARHVRGIVIRLLGCSGDVDDLAQDVFMAAFGMIGRLDSAASLKPWLTSIAVFTVRRHIRTKSRRRWLRFVEPAALPEQEAVHADLETQRALVQVYAILGELDVDDRVAFALRHIEGMELKEVADACKVSLATAKRRIKRAEEHLHRRIETESALNKWLAPVKQEVES